MILLANYEKALYTFWYNFSLSINYTHACSKNIGKAPEPCLCVLGTPASWCHYEQIITHSNLFEPDHPLNKNFRDQ